MDPSRPTEERKVMHWSAFLWGVSATLIMSMVMVALTFAKVSPMPRPVPIAIMGMLLGSRPLPLLVGLGVVAHLAYGGVWAALLAAWRPRISWRIGLGLGVALWVVMGLLVLPLLGWGLFGTAIDPRIAVATLVLHLVYGGTLAWIAMTRTQARGMETSVGETVR